LDLKRFRFQWLQGFPFCPEPLRCDRFCTHATVRSIIVQILRRHKPRPLHIAVSTR
jgi:hypothetical protein